jgi:hypothetical protein
MVNWDCRDVWKPSKAGVIKIETTETKALNVNDIQAIRDRPLPHAIHVRLLPLSSSVRKTLFLVNRLCAPYQKVFPSKRASLFPLSNQ